MDAMLEVFSTWMPWLLRSSLQGAVLVAVILAVQWVFGKRLSPAWRHAMWGLLVVRLLLIWAPASPLSVYNLAVREVAVVHMEAPAITAHTEISTVPKRPVPPDTVLTTEPRGGRDISDFSDGRDSRTWGSFVNGVDFRAAASLVWLGVFSLLILAMAGQSLHFGRQVRRGRIVTDSCTLELLEECRATLRVSPFLALVETDCVRSPALLGCIRPKLLLPCGFLDALSREEMRHVFLHELAHVKRGDIWSGWLFNLLLAAHWFNPAIWFARRRFIADREAACDARVLAALDVTGQRDYGHTVLNLTERFNASPWAPGMAGISETNSNLKRRITMIKQFRPPTRLAAWSGAGLCVCIGLATLTNAQEVKSKTAQAALDQPELSRTVIEPPQRLPEPVPGQEDISPTAVPIEPPRLKPGGGPVENAAQPVPPRPEPSEGNANLAQNCGGDIVCDPSDIYGYTATNGGTMIAAQLTNTRPQEVTVDVEFWDGGIESGTKIGRGALLIPPAKTATEAIPWVVKNGQHEITVRIDPGNTVAESDEENNRTLAGIEYTNGRFQPLELLISQNTVETRHVKGFAEEERGNAPIASVAPTTVLSNPKEDEQSSVPMASITPATTLSKRKADVQRSVPAASTQPTSTERKPDSDRVAAGNAGNSIETLQNDAQLRAVCQKNMQQLGLTFKMFANEIKGEVFPHLSREPGRLMFAWEGDGHALEGDGVLSEEFLTDHTLVGCPGSGPASIAPDDTDFAYLGYLMRNDDDVRRFAEAYERWASTDDGTGAWFTDDMPRSPEEGITRVREGVERFLITVINNPAGAALAQSQIPTLVEWPDRHAAPGGQQGGNVLFMDGHVEFIPYPGKWPMTEETIGILCKLARREPMKKLE